MLLQHLVSPLPRGATATPSDAGDPAGNDAAAYGLAALPPKVATAVQPRLAAVLRSATEARGAALSRQAGSGAHVEGEP